MENEEWSVRKNNQQLDKESGILRSEMKVTRMGWTVYLQRVADQDMSKISVQGKPGKRRPKGISRKTWLDSVEEILRMARGWKQMGERQKEIGDAL